MKNAAISTVGLTKHAITPIVSLHHESNYLKVMPGGHCFYCHKDFPNDHDFLKCMEEQKLTMSFPCPETCRLSKFFTPNFPPWVQR